MRGLLPAIKHILIESTSTFETSQWKIQQMEGDRNHQVFYCQSTQGEQLDLMVKLFDHTDEKRAWHEFSALRAIWTLNIQHVSPAPLLLLESYIAPDIDMLITEWVQGSEIILGRSLNKIQWSVILETLADLHQINRQSTRVKVAHSLKSLPQPVDYLNQLSSELDALDATVEDALRNLIRRAIERLQESLPHQWSDDVPATLIHGDWNVSNFALSDEGTVRFCDWEMSGWGDPAIDLACLLTHVSFMTVSLPDQRWLLETYQMTTDDATFSQRVNVYKSIFEVDYVLDTLKRLSAHPSDTLHARLKQYRTRLEQRYPPMD